MKFSILAIATVVSILGNTLVNAKGAPECNEYVTLQTLEGNYTIINGPAKIHMAGRVLSSPAAIAKGPATMAKVGNTIAFDSPIFGQLQLDMKITTIGKNEMDFTKWDFDGTDGDFTPIDPEDIALGLGCDKAVKTIRLRGEGSVDLPNVGTVPVTLWLQAIPMGIIMGRMDVIMPPGNLLLSKITMDRIGPLDYESSGEQEEQATDADTPEEADASDQKVEEIERAEQQLMREIETLETLDLLDDLDDLGVTQRLQDNGPIVDPDLEIKVIELKESGYLDNLDISELVSKP